ncbi:SCO family protein [Litchfieldia alkalitelluris]|uniref:SCO family protein n=1 Tax=Litchfieldia alkalitelluris TaxID=304268 RepID=UPI0009971C06|nr:SCO family protein [Litchfieldia alkalitelluris]
MRSYNTLSSVLVIIFGVSLFFIGTDGFTSFTAETARVNELVKENPTFPEVMLEDSEGRNYTISEFEGKHVFITFFYSMCTTVCIDLEVNMSKVYELIPSQYMGEDIVFLSISFDPKQDTPERLDQYKDLFHSDGETWRMARIPNQEELNSLLERFGVIVIPDEYGNFAHNSAFYLLDTKGTLIDVMDYTNVEDSAYKVIDILDKEEEK